MADTIEKVCEKHGKYTSFVTTVLGRKIESECPQCAEEKEKERIKKENEKEEQIRIESLSKIGIPERFLNCTLENYLIETDGCRKALESVKKYVSLFNNGIAQYPLFLTGNYGTGKTHLAIAALIKIRENNVIDEKRRSYRLYLYTSTMKMIRDIRGSYHPKSTQTEQEIINKYVRLDLLVLDEVGVQMGTENEKLLLFEVLNGRYENMRPTIFVSNLPYDELKAYLGERVMDRLRGGHGVLAVFDWESERRKQ